MAGSQGELRGVRHRAGGAAPQVVLPGITRIARRVPRFWRWSIAILGLLLLAIYAAAFFIDEPLRQMVERRMNENLVGYTARIGSLDFHPLGFSMDSRDVVITQNAVPDPPVAQIARMNASVEWRQLLRLHLVADFLFERPVLHLNLKQARVEARDDVKVQDRGWQDAVQATYPLKINLLRVVEGEVTYSDEGPFRPMHVSHLNIRAGNIRNIRSHAGEYPSDVHFDAVLLETATLRGDGHADFLAKPHPTLKTDIELRDLRLDYLQPALRHANLTVRRGTLSARGEIEYAATTNVLDLVELTIRGADIEYRYAEAAPAPERIAAKQAVKTSTQPAEQSSAVVRAEHIDIRDSRFGMVNAGADPQYKVFVGIDDLTVRNFSNQMRRGDATVKARGNFMGSGTATAEGVFRPDHQGPDFNLAVRIENVDMRTMNDLLRAYGGFDVTKGDFSFFSELRVRNGTVEGYVKPLFRDLDVYDPSQDKQKSLPRQIYEGIVGGVATLLENRPHDQVATETSVSGTVGDVHTSTWEMVVRLVQNAFFKAILPGLKRETGD